MDSLHIQVELNLFGSVGRCDMGYRERCVAEVERPPMNIKVEYEGWKVPMPWYKRSFDIVFSMSLILLLSPLFIALALGVTMSSRGDIIHWSKRVGKNNRIFLMPKFRSMLIETPQLPTHLLSNPGCYLTPIGSFLRGTSLDELPELFSILTGDLSFVGPRPALFNQNDLIELRTERQIHKLVPGLTGWAQVNGRDDLPIPVKVRYDLEYLQNQSLAFDLRIISATFFKVLRREGVRH
jgi:O-antigen biosynthesis protein WbqP